MTLGKLEKTHGEQQMKRTAGRTADHLKPSGRLQGGLLILVSLTVAVAATMTGSESVLAHVDASSGVLAGASTARNTTATAHTPVRFSSSADLLLSGFGDVNGYHLIAADVADPHRWVVLASILPSIGDESSWIGRQCLTGDGRYAVVTVAPRLATSHPDLVAHGGFAYSVSVTSGAVTPLLSGVTLGYFSPGCGAGDQVALTSFGSADDAPSSVDVFDVSTGRQTAAISSPGEVTSAVPVSLTSVIAVGGGTGLVELTPASSVSLARLPGQGFDLRPNTRGGVDLLSADLTGGTATVLSWTPSAGVQAFGSGPLTATALLGARNGTAAVVGARPEKVSVATSEQPVPNSPSPTDLTWLHAPANAGVEAVSANADSLLVELAGAAGMAIEHDNGQMAPVTLPTPDPRAGVTDAVPALLAGADGATGRDAVESTANTTTPTCAVPRLDVHHQIVQPSPAQIDWAVQMATRGKLAARQPSPTWTNPATGNRLTSYNPTTDFPLSVTVPREVMNGIMAAESNWDQASYHAIPGVPGDPLIGNYYGVSANGGSRDYASADCGYGLTQQTDGMRVGDTLWTQNTQQAIGLDYAENIAAGLSTLAGSSNPNAKWSQLSTLGITANDGNPAYIENWYFAIWAYNTGVHTPSGGPYGLGWANNPINPVYPANRTPFLQQSYADAAHPSDWPYQEQVMGWAAIALRSPVDGTTDYRGAAHYPLLPPNNQFCSMAQNSCNPSNASAPCTRSDLECWWHAPASWVDCGSSGCDGNCSTGWCTLGNWTLPTNAPEPATPANPSAPVCDVSGAPAPPASATFVDEEADGNPNDLHVSLNSGCGSSRSWTNSGTFSLTYGSMGMVDFHQLGAGFDGHMWFSHEVAAGDIADSVTGTWTPTLSKAGAYVIWVFVPGTGATASDASYTVKDGSGDSVTTSPVNQGSVSNAWVAIGQYPLSPGATLALSNATSVSSHDLAFDTVAFQLVAPARANYVALGDSFSSGIGAGGYDPASHQDGCYRSGNDSYPVILATQLSHVYANSLAFVACSGAQTGDLTVSGLSGEFAQDMWLTPATKLVTITIGGNDVGFAPILSSCFWGHGCGPSAFPNLPTQIQAMQSTLHSVYSTISADAPSAKVVVLTYPQIFPSDFTHCTPGETGNISASDDSWIRTNWAAFNTVIKKAASGVAGVSVLDEGNAFAGHDVCTLNNWANIPIIDPVGASFHPNIAGDKKLATDLETYLRLS
jgi:lysophospholipase L1-like esterase